MGWVQIYYSPLLDEGIVDADLAVLVLDDGCVRGRREQARGEEGGGGGGGGGRQSRPVRRRVWARGNRQPLDGHVDAAGARHGVG
jgi:hypothetical protein